MTSPSAPPPTVGKNLFLSFSVKNALYASALIWAFLATCFYLLRFSLLPFLEGARGWLDSLL